MKDKKEFTKIDNDLIANGKFTSRDNLDKDILNSAGLLCIKLKKNSRLPESYQMILNQRKYKFIYIGQSKTLRKRVKQLFGEKKPVGAFFRNIGCALDYLAEKSCLKETSDKKSTSFVFSEEHKKEITEWLYENTEWSIVKYNGNRNIIKTKLIKKYHPILNLKSNDMKLKELEEDIEKCKQIAKS